MNYSHYEVFCPMRAKRRQSDAKWRASVATCYDALKYVVPNVKQLSKRKISKALILQESEKHIQDLEEAIGHILNVECTKKGKEVLWKNEGQWSYCSLDRLRDDFSEQQRRVFHTTAHGRRCYNLLHDIKEEVFNMKADSKRMVFVKERFQKNITANVTGAEFSAEGGTKEEVQDVQLTILDQRKKGLLKDVSHFSQINFAGKNFGQLIRQQPRPRQRLCRTEDDSSLLEGHAENKGIPYSTVFYEISTNQQATLKGLKSEDEQPQLVPNMPSSFKSAHITTKKSLENDLYSGTSCASLKSTHENSTAFNSSIRIIQDKHEGQRSIKVENIGQDFYILSQEEDYTCLLKALKCEKEQEVPSLSAPTKTIKVLQSVLQRSCENDEISKRESVSGNTLQLFSSKKNEFKNKTCRTPVKTKVISPSCSDLKEQESKHLAEPIFTVFTSPLNLSCLDAKKEVDVAQVSSKGDPFLSSLSTPKSNATFQFGQSDSDFLIKRPNKSMSARKKLNFNCPPYSATSIFGPRLLSPERSVRSPPSKTGFTPIKLPDDLGQNSEEINTLDTFVSPWKVLNSPFDSKTCSRGYHSSDYLEDNLLCLETIDALELDDGLSNEITPTHSSGPEISEPGGSCKRKSSFVSPSCGSKGQPKCRKRLERFYDQPPSSNNNCTESDDSHVVPELDARQCRDLSYVSHDLYSSSSTPLKDSCSEVGDCSDFDGFFFYYRQVSQKLKDRIGIQEMNSPTVAAKVAHMWARLPQQDRMTLSTLAHLEAHGHKDSESFGNLSQDLEDIKVEPLDPQEFMPSFI